MVQVRHRSGLDRLGAPPKGATDVQEKRSDEAQGQENLAKAKVQLAKFKARAKVELSRHARAFKLAAKRYRVALKNS